MPTDNICLICSNKLFKGIKFCSPECYVEARARMRIAREKAHAEHMRKREEACYKKCLTCGKDFKSQTPAAKYCCRRCKNINGMKNELSRKVYARPEIRKLELLCKHCNSIFHPNRRGQIFCSSKCKQQNKYTRQIRTKVCSNKDCRKEFEATFNRNYCCLECKSLGRRRANRCISCKRWFIRPEKRFHKLHIFFCGSNCANKCNKYRNPIKIEEAEILPM